MKYNYFESKDDKETYPNTCIYCTYNEPKNFRCIHCIKGE